MLTGNIYNNNLRGAYVTSPLSPVYDENGDYFNTANESWNNNDGNPLGTMMMNRYNRTKNMSVDANIYAQIIDDVKGVTLCSASTLDKDFEGNGGNKEAAKKVGEAIGKRALAKGIETVCFDRGGFLYHGRVAELAAGAREAGLKF